MWSSDDTEIEEMFEKSCFKLDMDPGDKMKDMVIYEMTDGNRTSTSLDGWKRYVDGGLFALRFVHMLDVLGCKSCYVNVTHERHKQRDNYSDIYEGLRQLVDIYREYAKDNDVKLRFMGDRSTMEPELRDAMEKLETLTSNRRFAIYFLVNYSARWATATGALKNLPDANVIVRHTKGYVNGDMWLHGKLDNNSFVYVQNGSSHQNWSDQQLIYLIALSFRSMILNAGTHYSKTYGGVEAEEIRKKREVELALKHVRLESNPNKRVIIFGPFSPEIYEF